MRTVHIRVPDQHVAQLEAIAAIEERDLSWIVRRAIRDFLQATLEPAETVAQRSA